MNDKQPCHNCGERRLGCHAECEKYKELRKMFDLAKENREKIGDERRFLYAVLGRWV